MNATRHPSRTSSHTADDIRSALVASLVNQAAHGPALILHELRVGSGKVTYVVAKEQSKQRPRRPAPKDCIFSDTHPEGLPYWVDYSAANVDVALLTPDALDLYEIKGPQDSFARLRSQISAYDETGSKNTLVVDEGHAERACAATPEHWRILVAAGEPISFTELRSGRANPNRTTPGLTYPLYARELQPLAFAFEIRSRRASRIEIIDFLDHDVAIDEAVIATWLREQLAQRNHDSVFDPFGYEIGEKKYRATAIGDISAWPRAPIPINQPLFAEPAATSALPLLEANRL